MAFKRGDHVVCRVYKHTAKPGPRAKGIRPEPKGEQYFYHVEKYWIVYKVLTSGELVLVTRTGKEHIVPSDDPRLRKPNWFEAFFLRHRFPVLEKDK